MLLPCSYQFQFHARIFSRLYSRIRKTSQRVCTNANDFSHLWTFSVQGYTRIYGPCTRFSGLSTIFSFGFNRLGSKIGRHVLLDSSNVRTKGYVWHRFVAPKCAYASEFAHICATKRCRTKSFGTNIGTNTTFTYSAKEASCACRMPGKLMFIVYCVAGCIF